MKNIVTLIIAIILLTGCKQSYIGDFEKNLDSIYINLIDTHESGMSIYYTFELKNESERTLEAVELLMGFETLQEYKSSGHPNNIMFNAEPDEEPFGIEPNESIYYRVEFPIGLVKEELLHLEQMEIFMKGYFEEVNAMNSFSKSGNIEYFEKSIQ